MTERRGASGVIESRRRRGEGQMDGLNRLACVIRGGKDCSSDVHSAAKWRLRSRWSTPTYGGRSDGSLRSRWRRHDQDLVLPPLMLVPAGRRQSQMMIFLNAKLVIVDIEWHENSHRRPVFTVSLQETFITACDLFIFPLSFQENLKDKVKWNPRLSFLLVFRLKFQHPPTKLKSTLGPWEVLFYLHCDRQIAGGEERFICRSALPCPLQPLSEQLRLPL